MSLVLWYLQANTLLIFLGIVASGLQQLALRRPTPGAFRLLLRVSYAVGVAALILPVAMQFIATPQVFRPAAQVWTYSSMHRAASGALPNPGLQVLSTKRSSFSVTGNLILSNL